MSLKFMKFSAKRMNAIKIYLTIVEIKVHFNEQITKIKDRLVKFLVRLMKSQYN